jgi:hypothetical protein
MIFRTKSCGIASESDGFAPVFQAFLSAQLVAQGCKRVAQSVLGSGPLVRKLTSRVNFQGAPVGANRLSQQLGAFCSMTTQLHNGAPMSSRKESETRGRKISLARTRAQCDNRTIQGRVVRRYSMTLKEIIFLCALMEARRLYI